MRGFALWRIFEFTYDSSPSVPGRGAFDARGVNENRPH